MPLELTDPKQTSKQVPPSWVSKFKDEIGALLQQSFDEYQKAHLSERLILQIQEITPNAFPILSPDLLKAVQEEGALDKPDIIINNFDELQIHLEAIVQAFD